jgi:YegS/Rv2252/BmrU family lipid kinase
MGNSQTAFIVNPHAGNGSTGQAWSVLAAYAQQRLGDFQTRLTRVSGEAAHRARSAVEDGVSRLICMGGDGTLNEVVNGVMAASCRPPDLVLGFVPNGTGCDLVRTLPIPRDVRRAIDLIAAGESRPLDLGRLRFRGHGGLAADRYFHNITSFGLGGEVDARVNRTTKVFGPFLSFIWATLVSILRYGKKTIRIRTESGFDRTVRVWNVAVANGQFHGGGMWVAPEARLDDGRFHVVVIGDLSLAGVCRNLHKLYNGKIRSIAQVTTVTAARVEAESDEAVLLDVDGEQPGTLPLAAEIVPGALRVFSK